VRRAKFCLRLIFTATIMLALVYAIGWSSIINAILEVNIYLLLLAWLLALVGRYVESAQMSRIMRQATMPISTTKVFLANSLSTFYGLILPGDLIAGIAKWANLSAIVGKKSGVLNAMVYNRVMLLFPWIPAGLIALALYNPTSSVLFPAVLTLISILCFLLAILFYHPVTGPKLNNFLSGKFQAWLPGRISAKTEGLLSSLRSFYCFPWLFHFKMFIRGVLVLGIAVLKFVVTAAALKISLPILVLVWVLCFIKLVSQLPISFHGLGVREGILVATLSLYSVGEASAFSLGILSFSSVLIFAFIGCIYQICLSFGWVNLAQQHSSKVS